MYASCVANVVRHGKVWTVRRRERREKRVREREGMGREMEGKEMGKDQGKEREKTSLTDGGATKTNDGEAMKPIARQQGRQRDNQTAGRETQNG